MRKEENGIFAEEPGSISIRESLSKYFSYWPLFVLSVLLCGGAGYIYAKYTVPQYMATSTFLIIGTKSGSSAQDDLVQAALSGKKEINVNNELLLLNSAALMERTVDKNDFNIFYIKKGKILDLEIYKDAPFTLTAKELTDSNRSYSIYIKKIDALGGTFLYGSEKEEKKYSFRWNEPFTISNQLFILSPKGAIQDGDGEYIVKWEPVSWVAGGLSANLTVKAYDTRTNAIVLTVKTENLKKGEDVLNGLFNEFNRSDIEDRNKLSRSTVQFIDDRLVNITSELKGVEGNLESYQGNNQLIDIKSQSAQSMGNANDVSRSIKDLAIQQGVASMILNYFANPANNSKLVPSSLGLNDATLASLISQYNELQLRKEREAPLVAPNSTVMQDLNTQIENLRSSILESLSNISKNLRLQEKGLQQQSNQYQSMLSSVPHNERVMQEIKRKQSITEGLYLYLFQKREEAAISSTTSSVPHYKQLDLAKGYGPVEPNRRNIITYSALLGLFLAFAYIYIKDLLNDKVVTKEDIIKRSSVPILGQIAHIAKRKKRVICVLDRNIIAEQFRAIRTNISFLMKDKDKKTVLITSSASGEGKSFISLNLAAVFAIPGKKVALLEFDIRQPVIATSLNINNAKGITNFLTGDIERISDIFHVSEEIPSLHIYPSGPTPSNPGDLLVTGKLSRLFATLKAEYDYIIVDSPPAGLVSDAFLLGEFSDMVLYVLRSQKTVKKQIEFINEVVNNKSISDVALILNDVRNSDNYGGYGYGNDAYYNDQKVVKKKRLIST
jgi:capsular exopolysaccharide synthesis family protein